MSNTKQISEVSQLANPTQNTELLCLNGGGVNKLKISALENNINPKMLDGKTQRHVAEITPTTLVPAPLQVGWYRIGTCLGFEASSFLICVGTTFAAAPSSIMFAVSVAGSNSVCVTQLTSIHGSVGVGTIDKVRVEYGHYKELAFDVHVNAARSEDIRAWAVGNIHIEDSPVFDPAKTDGAYRHEFNIQPGLAINGTLVHSRT